MHWPDGPGTTLHLDGSARDLVTAGPGRSMTIAEGSISVTVGPEREIETLAVSPDRPWTSELVGARGGGRLRQAIEAAASEERLAGTPLYLLLDDVPSATLIAAFAYTRWRDSWRALTETTAEAAPDSAPITARRLALRRMEGICAGFRPGSSALGPEGLLKLDLHHNVAAVPPLADPADPEGWHALAPHPPLAMRRARRIDVWPNGNEIAVDAMFRDSSWEPDGTEVAVHEYRIEANADAGTGTLTSVTAEPRVLPYPECPAAAPNAARMAGRRLRRLRSEVLEELRGTDCCTHLNDALRALAEVPVMLEALRRSTTGEP